MLEWLRVWHVVAGYFVVNQILYFWGFWGAGGGGFGQYIWYMIIDFPGSLLGEPVANWFAGHLEYDLGSPPHLMLWHGVSVVLNVSILTFGYRITQYFFQ